MLGFHSNGPAGLEIAFGAHDEWWDTSITVHGEVRIDFSADDIRRGIEPLIPLSGGFDGLDLALCIIKAPSAKPELAA